MDIPSHFIPVANSKLPYNTATMSVLERVWNRIETTAPVKKIYTLAGPSEPSKISSVTSQFSESVTDYLSNAGRSVCEFVDESVSTGQNFLSEVFGSSELRGRSNSYTNREQLRTQIRRRYSLDQTGDLYEKGSALLTPNAKTCQDVPKSAPPDCSGMKQNRKRIRDDKYKLGSIKAENYFNFDHRLSGYDPLSIPGILPTSIDKHSTKKPPCSPNTIDRIVEESLDTGIHNADKTKACQDWVDSVNKGHGPLIRKRSSSLAYTGLLWRTDPTTLKEQSQEPKGPSPDSNTNGNVSDTRANENMNDEDVSKDQNKVPRNTLKQNVTVHGYECFDNENEDEGQYKVTPHPHRRHSTSVLLSDQESLEYAIQNMKLKLEEASVMDTKDCYGMITISLQYLFMKETLKVKVLYFEKNLNSKFVNVDKKESFYVKICELPESKTTTKRTQTVKGAGIFKINKKVHFKHITFENLHLKTLRFQLFKTSKWKLNKDILIAETKVCLDNLDVINEKRLSKQMKRIERK